MCGVIAYCSSTPDLKLFKKLVLESSIRGLHATGISFIRDDNIHTVKESLSAKEFLRKHKVEEFLDINGGLYCIVHCRYSTSDLDWNQPIDNGKFSIVHNGVVTQELPENWENKFGFKCEGKNDSELILKTLESNSNPIKVWSNSSMSVIELWHHRKLRFYRNGKRPLWWKNSNEELVVVSTKDIAIRSGIKQIQNCIPFAVYTTVDMGKNVTSTVLQNKARDLQDAI